MKILLRNEGIDMTLFFMVLIIFSFGFLCGYLSGKKQGRQIGMRESEAVMPLILRQNSLETGCCVICGQSEKNTCQDNTGLCREKST